MLGIFLLYFIGKPFYQLAEEYYKSKWLYAILSIAIYYATQFVAGMILGAISIWIDYNILALNQFLLLLICLPFCILALWGFYRMLKKRWSNETVRNEKELNEQGIIDDHMME
jgi:membrane glycosyltransferase